MNRHTKLFYSFSNPHVRHYPRFEQRPKPVFFWSWQNEHQKRLRSIGVTTQDLAGLATDSVFVGHKWWYGQGARLCAPSHSRAVSNHEGKRVLLMETILEKRWPGWIGKETIEDRAGCRDYRPQNTQKDEIPIRSSTINHDGGQPSTNINQPRELAWRYHPHGTLNHTSIKVHMRNQHCYLHGTINESYRHGGLHKGSNLLPVLFRQKRLRVCRPGSLFLTNFCKCCHAIIPPFWWSTFCSAGFVCEILCPRLGSMYAHGQAKHFEHMRSQKPV
jgi:hypothetical protein